MDGVITAIEPQARRGGRRSNVFLDGRYAFSLSTELAERLHVGEAIGAAAADRLLDEDQRLRAYDAALRFLAVRPRSEREIRDRLARHQFAPQIVDGAIERLRQLDLVDDAAFAAYWVDQRRSHRPRGGRLLKQELRLKGVDADVAETAISAEDDEEEDIEAGGAYRAAVRKAQSLRNLDERTFRQRLGAFLQRRGFDYETSRSVVLRLWNETRSQ